MLTAAASSIYIHSSGLKNKMKSIQMMETHSEIFKKIEETSEAQGVSPSMMLRL